jgi:23S rRNA (uracil1939-C5)-methyltransferase
LVGVEIVPSAVRYARINAKQIKITNYTIIEAPSEQMPPDTLDRTDVLIVHPPRSGMHCDVIEMITTHRPKRILYLSCNPVTQAGDIALLMEHYSLSLLEGYDFYTHVLHLEALAVLDRK